MDHPALLPFQGGVGLGDSPAGLVHSRVHALLRCLPLERGGDQNGAQQGRLKREAKGEEERGEGEQGERERSGREGKRARE